MNGWLFGVIVIGLYIVYLIAQQICYAYCWKNSDNKMKEKLIASGNDITKVKKEN